METVRSEGKEGTEVIGAAFKVIAGEPGPREDRKSPEAQPSQELELEEPTSDTLAASQCLPSKDKPLNSLTRDGALGWYLSSVAYACSFWSGPNHPMGCTDKVLPRAHLASSGFYWVLDASQEQRPGSQLSLTRVQRVTLGPLGRMNRLLWPQ